MVLKLSIWLFTIKNCHRSQHTACFFPAILLLVENCSTATSSNGNQSSLKTCSSFRSGGHADCPLKQSAKAGYTSIEFLLSAGCSGDRQPGLPGAHTAQGQADIPIFLPILRHPWDQASGPTFVTLSVLLFL